MNSFEKGQNFEIIGKNDNVTPPLTDSTFTQPSKELNQETTKRKPLPTRRKLIIGVIVGLATYELINRSGCIAQKSSNQQAESTK